MLRGGNLLISKLSQKAKFRKYFSFFFWAYEQFSRTGRRRKKRGGIDGRFLGGGKLRLRWQGRLPPSVANVKGIGDQLMKINRVGTEM